VAPKIRRVTFTHPPVNVVGADTVVQLIDVIDGSRIRESVCSLTPRHRQIVPAGCWRRRNQARSGRLGSGLVQNVLDP
jgi:hypothetical protein